jgi:hypothetical protein
MENYILFEYDHGGLNNIRKSLKFIIFLAKILNRTLVIPPAQSIYHFDWGPNSWDEKNTEKTSETHLKDVVNIDSYNGFKKVIKIIDFNEFCLKTELNLPSDFNIYTRLISDYETMYIQGNRLKYKIKDKTGGQRGYHFPKRAKYLEKLQSPENKDWVKYALENFYCSKEFDVNRFIGDLENCTHNVIFLPMDVNLAIKNNWIYPRIYDFTNKKFSKLNLYNNIWNTNPRMEFFNSNFYDIANKIIKNYIDSNYCALHYRNKGFDQNIDLTDKYILDYVSNKNKSNLPVYIATDNYEKIFTNTNTTIDSYPFKILSLKDIFIDQYLDNKKYISIIEFIICIKSNIFIGTPCSTFTSEILSDRCHSQLNTNWLIK